MSNVHVPDPAFVGAKSEAARQFSIKHPNATIEEIMAFSDGMDAGIEIERGRNDPKR